MQLSKKIITLAIVVFICVYVRAQSTVSGVVKEASSGKGLGGINITYKDFSAAITDSTGSFTLKVPSYDVAIFFEGEGYQSKEVALRGRNSVRVDLYEDTYTSFYDAATLPFGTSMKSLIPWSVTSIQTNGAWGSAAETPSSYLQGKVPGLNAIRRSGTPNIGATLFIRGMHSLYATNQPLVIVDGVIFDIADYGGSIIGNHYTDPLSTLDVRDIDNITVMKDGSSVYGTKGANGVIIITTARAKELATRIDFGVYGGINFTPSRIPVMNPYDYRVYLTDILKSKGMTDAEIQNQPYMNDDPNNPDYFRYHNNTDWQNQVMNKTNTKNIYLKVTGGDNIAKYALSLGYMDNGAITKNTDLKKYNMRFNSDLNLSKRMTATTNLSFTFNEQNLRDQGVASKTNPIFLSLIKSPLLFYKEIADNGLQSPSLADRDTFNISNPLVITDVAVGVDKNYRFLGSIGFNYQLSKEFAIATTVGVTNDKVRESFFIPRKGVTSDTLSTDIAYSRLGSQVKRLFSLYNDTRVTYSKTFRNVHQLLSRLGARYLRLKTEQDFGLGYNSATDELISVGNGVNALRRVGGDIGESNWLNVYFNTDYSYADKYYLSFNIAADGSSRFGKNMFGGLNFNGNNYAILPSLAGAWLISSEKFMKNKNINLLKLRASVGVTGNDDIGNNTARQYYVSQNLLGLEGLVRGGVGNDRLQWEREDKMNLGLDAAILDERINLTIDAFHDATKRMITYEPVVAQTGFSYVVTNSGRMKTNGIEAALNARIINKTSFKWDAGITIGKSASEIIKLPTDRILTNFGGATYITTKGEVPNLFYGYKTNGVFVSDDVAAQENLSIRKPDGSLVAFKGGDVRFIDVNGDHVIDENDRQVIGNPNPAFFGAITNRFQYKQFTLDALLTFVQGNDLYNYTRNQLEAGSSVANQTEALLNRWRTNGHQTDIPKATWGDPMGNSRFSDRWIEDGSYLRLRTVTLSYNISFNSEFFKYGVVYLTANNLFTATKYKGFDPEFSPTESIFGQGVDNTLEPQFKSMQLGIRIGL